VLETDQATPYFLNRHLQDVAHSLMVGATGAGKSFLLNFSSRAFLTMPKRDFRGRPCA
jgi:type IV secretory pathway VirB4 component